MPDCCPTTLVTCCLWPQLRGPPPCWWWETSGQSGASRPLLGALCRFVGTVAFMATTACTGPWWGEYPDWPPGSVPGRFLLTWAFSFDPNLWLVSSLVLCLCAVLLLLCGWVPYLVLLLFSVIEGANLAHVRVGGFESLRVASFFGQPLHHLFYFFLVSGYPGLPAGSYQDVLATGSRPICLGLSVGLHCRPSLMTILASGSLPMMTDVAAILLIRFLVRGVPRVFSICSFLASIST